MSDKAKEVMVEVKDTVEAQAPAPVTANEGAAAGLDPREVALGKDSGVLVDEAPAKTDEPAKEEGAEPKKEDGEEPKKEEGAEEPAKKEGEPAAKKEPEKKDPEAEREEAMKDPAKEQKLLKTYNPNEKALYFKQKTERLKRQQAERDRDAATNRANFLETQNKALLKKNGADPNADLLKDLEELDENGDPKPGADKDKPLTVGDLENIEKEKKQKNDKAVADARVVAERLEVQNSEAKSKYDDFDEVMDLADEVMKGDKHGVYAMKLIALAADPDGNAAEYAYTLGKLHPNYGKHRKEPAKKDAAPGGDPKKVQRIVDNAQKPQSSAALGGASEKGRLVSENDLTIEDVAGMSQSQWDGLSQRTRDRLMRA